MGLSNKREEHLRKMPLIQSKVFKSKNGALLVHRTVITDIKPVEYYRKVMETAGDDMLEELELQEIRI